MQTYTERRQAILFKAARDMRSVACEILDEVQLQSEFIGRSASWAKSTAASTARQARELETLGHEQTIADGRQNGLNYRSLRAYEAAIDHFEERARFFGVDAATL